ncbi:MAG: GNAT family N-acetyltransferase [Anaerolineae bacterium]
MEEITLQLSPTVSSEDLNALFAASWDHHRPVDFQPILQRSFVYVCAVYHERLIGFVNVAWDGGKHGFLLDTTVHPDFQRQGVGRRLVQAAVDSCRARGLDWLHVDFEPHLSGFYRACGFQPTAAGLIHLSDNEESQWPFPR